MSVVEIIQIITTLILFFTLLVFIFQANAQTKALKYQKKFFEAQVLALRYDWYNSIENVYSNEYIKFVDIFPENWADKSKWIYYNERQKRVYLFLVDIYDYWSFLYKMREKGLISDEDMMSTEVWIKDVLKNQPMLRDVHNYHGKYYPKLKDKIDKFYEEL